MFPNSRYETVGVMAGDRLPVRVATRELGVSESSYYDWRSRPPSARPVRNA
jgi:putative transposase